jgi:hypothetical protein
MRGCSNKTEGRRFLALIGMGFLMIYARGRPTARSGLSVAFRQWQAGQPPAALATDRRARLTFEHRLDARGWVIDGAQAVKAMPPATFDHVLVAEDDPQRGGSSGGVATSRRSL